MNGEFVKWEDATVHVRSHGLHYGTGVFEGIRCYDTEIGPAIFRHQDHLDRLAKSAELYYLPLEHSLEELREATKELIRRNGLRSCYIRPLAFRGYGEMGLYAKSAPVDVIIRKSVIQIARDLGYTVVERDIARAELYLAEEVFLTGTAAELVPVREIDDHDVGVPGEITRVIQSKFDDALHGRLEEYREWL